jgi:hypothetical protein
MNRSPRALLTTIALFGGLAATGCQTGGESLLFVQSADSALITPVGDDTYTLELRDVASNVTYFTDRPGRDTGTMPTDLFIERWSEGHDSFADDPPNAAVTVADEDTIWVIELMHPELEGSTLRYRVKFLDDSPHFQATAARGTAPPTAESVVLFIDNLTYSRRDPMNRPDNFGRRHERYHRHRR